MNELMYVNVWPIKTWPYHLQERRMKQQREILRKEKETADKIAARAFAQSYLADLVPSVFGSLSDNGYFYDPVERGKLDYLLCILIFPKG